MPQLPALPGARSRERHPIPDERSLAAGAAAARLARRAAGGGDAAVSHFRRRFEPGGGAGARRLASGARATLGPCAGRGHPNRRAQRAAGHACRASRAAALRRCWAPCGTGAFHLGRAGRRSGGHRLGLARSRRGRQRTTSSGRSSPRWMTPWTVSRWRPCERGLTVECVPGAICGGCDAKLAARFTHELLIGETQVRIWGGESTVRLPAHPGRGGRNQHLALAAARLLPEYPRAAAPGGGNRRHRWSDRGGGGLVDAETCARLALAGLDLDDCLARADSGDGARRGGCAGAHRSHRHQRGGPGDRPEAAARRSVI